MHNPGYNLINLINRFSKRPAIVSQSLATINNRDYEGSLWLKTDKNPAWTPEDFSKMRYSEAQPRVRLWNRTFLRT